MKSFEHASCVTAGFGVSTALGVLTETGAKASAVLTMIAFSVWLILVIREIVKQSRLPR